MLVSTSADRLRNQVRDFRATDQAVDRRLVLQMSFTRTVGPDSLRVLLHWKVVKRGDLIP